MTPFIAVLIPFIGAVALGLAARNDRLRDTIAFITPLPLFLVVIWLAAKRLSSGDAMTQTLIEIMPGLDITLAIQPLGLTFALLASTLYIVATPYALGYMKTGGYGNLARFMACYAIALGAAMGIAFSENLLTLYLSMKFSRSRPIHWSRIPVPIRPAAERGPIWRSCWSPASD